MFGNSQPKKLRIGVVRGGPSSEYDISLKTGRSLIEVLRTNDNYEVQDILVDKNGVWHIGGLARPFERIFPHLDVVVNALHGAYGEDGRMQQLLEAHSMPFTGSGSLGAAISLNKPLAKKYFKLHGLLTPEHFIIKRDEYTPQLLHKIAVDFPHLRFVKPATAGSSFGVKKIDKKSQHVVVNTDELHALDKAISHAFEHSDSVMVEEYIKGREATCGVLQSTADVHGGQAFALHPIQVQEELIHPSEFSPEEIARIQQIALDAHNALGLRHYSNSDFIVNRKGIYILEVDSLPSLAPTSRFPKGLSVADISLRDFADHIIALAIEQRQNR